VGKAASRAKHISASQPYGKCKAGCSSALASASSGRERSSNTLHA